MSGDVGLSSPNTLASLKVIADGYCKGSNKGLGILTSGVNIILVLYLPPSRLLSAKISFIFTTILKLAAYCVAEPYRSTICA